LAAAALHQVEQGIDPGEAKARRATAPAAPEIFEVIADEYLNREGKRLRSAEEWRATLKRLVHPTLGARQISEIRRSEIVRLLDRIENERGPVMADSTLAIVRTIMNWHAARSDDFRTPIVRGMARTRPRERARDRVLTDDELRALWPTAEASGQFGAFLRFLLLTGARRNEAARATWGEISDGDWVLPPIRNKTKVELIRPLSDAARRMLDAVKEGAGDKKLGFIFSSDGGVRPLGGFSKSKRAFDKAAGVKNWTLHDLRRTARSLMSRAGVSSDHAERCLGHAIGGVRATYDRHEYYAEKRRAFDALATQIELILHPRKNVLVITGMQA
jgi:integrase